MKKFLRLLVLTISILMVSVPVFASDLLVSSYDTMLISSFDDLYDTTIANGLNMNAINVQLNGEFIDFTDSNGNKVEPQIINDRTMVPMRKIFEVLGANVEWVQETRSIIATTDELKIGLQIGNQNATVTTKDGITVPITLDSAPVIVDDRTLVPVRFIAESLNKIVGWDVENRSVIIIEPALIENKIKVSAPTLYEYLTTDFETILTSETKTDIVGKIKYQDTENSLNNSTLNIAGEALAVQDQTKIKIDLELDVTGKGVLILAVKDESLDEINASIVIDKVNGYMYVSSNIYGDELNGKWIRYELEPEQQAALNSSFAQGNTMENFIAALIQEENLVISSYDDIETQVDVIISLMNDDNFTSSGRTTKTYDYNLKLAELLEMFNLTAEEKTAFASKYDGEVSSKFRVSNNVVRDANTTISFDVKEENEVVNVEVELESDLESYNEEVSIEIPDAKDVVVKEVE